MSCECHFKHVSPETLAVLVAHPFLVDTFIASRRAAPEVLDRWLASAPEDRRVRVLAERRFVEESQSATRKEARQLREEREARRAAWPYPTIFWDVLSIEHAGEMAAIAPRLPALLSECPGPGVDVHKRWGAIHRLFTGTEPRRLATGWETPAGPHDSGRLPLSQAVLGGRELGSTDLGGLGPARYLPADDVRELAGALELALAAGDLSGRLGADPWLAESVAVLVAYYTAAARAGHAMLTWLV